MWWAQKFFWCKKNFFVEAKPKSETRKRSVSEKISVKFRLDQRSFDKPNCSYMLPVMENIASFLSCNDKTYVIKPALTEVLSVSVQSIYIYIRASC